MTNYGYWKLKLNTTAEHYILGLNTNLYYIYDDAQMNNKADPGGQFAFIDNHFKSVSDKSITHIIAHIAPGGKCATLFVHMTIYFSIRA
jgi:hypothetical protein